MAATLYVAVFDAATTDPSWARADVGNGRNGWQASGYVASAVDTSPPTSTTNDDAPGITLPGLTPGSSYKLWAIWDDGSQSSNKVSSSTFVATPTLTVAVAAHTQAADNTALTVTTVDTLSVASASHAQSSGSASLVVVSVLANASASHAQTASEANLSSAGTANLIVAGASHSQAASSPTLGVTTYADLTVAGASHSQAASQVTLSITAGSVTLTVSAATHQQLATSPVFGDLVALIYKILANKQILDPVTGELIIYDDDGSTVLFRADAWADPAGTTRYAGGPLSRIDRLH